MSAASSPSGRGVLITGGAGFIGSNLVHAWLDSHPDDRVVVLDALTYAGVRASLADVEDRIRFVHGDIGDQPMVEALLVEERIDLVVNLAAESHNSLAVVDPGRFFAANVMGTQRLLEACRRGGGVRFHHVSTCEVYGDLPLGPAAAPFTEDSPYRPRTPYNASKAAADHAVRAYHQTYGLPITISNCANNYGPFQFPEKVMPLFTALALDDRPLPLYRSSDHTREWVHVSDHCAAIALVVDRGRIGATYHVGTGEERSVEQIADAVLAALGKPGSLKEWVTDRPGHDRRYLLDSARISDELGWAPAVSFDQGLADTVAWYAANRDWWEPLAARAPVQESAW